MIKDVGKLVGVLIILGFLLWGWYSLFPNYAYLAWFVSVSILVSIFGRDYQFFKRKNKINKANKGKQ